MMQKSISESQTEQALFDRLTQASTLTHAVLNDFTELSLRLETQPLPIDKLRLRRQYTAWKEHFLIQLLKQVEVTEAQRGLIQQFCNIVISRRHDSATHLCGLAVLVRDCHKGAPPSTTLARLLASNDSLVPFVVYANYLRVSLSEQADIIENIRSRDDTTSKKILALVHDNPSGYDATVTTADSSPSFFKSAYAEVPFNLERSIKVLHEGSDAQAITALNDINANFDILEADDLERIREAMGSAVNHTLSRGTAAKLEALTKYLQFSIDHPKYAAPYTLAIVQHLLCTKPAKLVINSDKHTAIICQIYSSYAEREKEAFVRLIDEHLEQQLNPILLINCVRVIRQTFPEKFRTHFKTLFDQSLAKAIDSSEQQPYWSYLLLELLEWVGEAEFQKHFHPHCKGFIQHLYGTELTYEHRLDDNYPVAVSLFKKLVPMIPSAQARTFINQHNLSHFIPENWDDQATQQILLDFIFLFYTHHFRNSDDTTANLRQMILIFSHHYEKQYECHFLDNFSGNSIEAWIMVEICERLDKLNGLNKQEQQCLSDTLTYFFGAYAELGTKMVHFVAENPELYFTRGGFKKFIFAAEDLLSRHKQNTTAVELLQTHCLSAPQHADIKEDIKLFFRNNILNRIRKRISTITFEELLQQIQPLLKKYPELLSEQCVTPIIAWMNASHCVELKYRTMLTESNLTVENARLFFPEFEKNVATMPSYHAVGDGSFYSFLCLHLATFEAAGMLRGIELPRAEKLKHYLTRHSMTSGLNS